MTARGRVRLDLILLIAILVLAALLRLYQLDGSSLWSDEGNSWALSQRSFTRIAADAAADIHPPGYYWLLKAWTALFGSTAAAMRSLSALLGVLLVAAVYGIGTRFDDPDADSVPAIGLLAAFLAAVNPFQVYYSQEARMYMLLALLAAGLFWSLLALTARLDAWPATPSWRTVAVPAAAFVLCGAAGLWTHYSFPVLLAAANLAFVWHALRRRQARTLGRELALLAAINGLILVAYLPWLPTAVDRVLSWPRGGVDAALRTELLLALQTLVFGPARSAPALAWPWLVAGAALPVAGGIALRRRAGIEALVLWLAAPLAMMALLGLFSPAFLKFLLAASPAWCVLTAGSIALARWRRWAALPIAAGAALLAWQTLPAYYGDPAARDNYAGIARYIQVVGDPAADLVLLDAPGQQEVWAYYDPGLPVLALPQQRPADAEATQQALAAAAADRRRIFALFWATDEADPGRVVESWLDQHAFKGLDSWQGNLRFVVYSLPNRLQCTALDPAAAFGDAMALVEQCQPAAQQTVAAGDVALVRLIWRALAALDHRYKVTVQVLDSRGQVVAQHDAEPAGGSQPTDAWQPGDTVTDNHGVAIPPGTPPGVYRLSVAVYDAASGERLPTADGDALALGEVRVAPAAGRFPPELLPIQHRVDKPLGPATLAGYDLYHRGFGHAPDTPVAPGELVHLVFYWQAPDPLPPDWPADQGFVVRLGGQEIAAPLAGGAHPTGRWQAGELVRGEFDIPYDGSAQRPQLHVGQGSITLAPVP